jgi:hypothetical protein
MPKTLILPGPDGAPARQVWGVMAALSLSDLSAKRAYP